MDSPILLPAPAYLPGTIEIHSEVLNNFMNINLMLTPNTCEMNQHMFSPGFGAWSYYTLSQKSPFSHFPSQICFMLLRSILYVTINIPDNYT